MGKYTYAFLLQNDSTVTSQCMKFIFGDEKEVYLLDKSVLPVTEKKVCKRGKKRIGPGMKYGHANPSSFCAHTNERVCVV